MFPANHTKYVHRLQIYVASHCGIMLTAPLLFILDDRAHRLMIGWKHVGETRFTESLVWWSIRTASLLCILDGRAHILYDWLETRRWDKIYWIIGLTVNKDCPFSGSKWTCTYLVWLAENKSVLCILDDRAQILYDWLDTRRWDKPINKRKKNMTLQKLSPLKAQCWGVRVLKVPQLAS